MSTGRDPRAVGGNGGAIINYVCHSMETTIEPLVQLITSGVFQRHRGLRAGIVESGIGFVPWLLETMDYAYKAHHFWVRPVIPELPSVYFRQSCFATFQEDHEGLSAVEPNELVENVMWANDYPHHEGELATLGSNGRAADESLIRRGPTEDPRTQRQARLQPLNGAPREGNHFKY